MPRVSIILPTYNRESFLGEAFQAIRDQQCADWELIVVDDGSTDNTRELVEREFAAITQPTKYIYQANQGAYGARNIGLDHAKGDFVAFYDSDDLWLPHHLENCVRAFELCPEVDWVYGACKMVEYSSGKVIAPNTFYQEERRRPFLELASIKTEALHTIVDNQMLDCAIAHGLFCGLQNSLIRRSVFSNRRFESESRNEAEDQLVVIQAVLSGFKFGYLDDVHVQYAVHDSNSSAAGGQHNLQRQERVIRSMILGFENLVRDARLPARSRKLLRKRIGEDWFWKLGYSTLAAKGDFASAITAYKRGLFYWPWNWRQWKTMIVMQSRRIASVVFIADKWKAT